MEYRDLGKSGLKVPVVSFGAWAIGGWMWGGTDDDLAVRAIHKAIDLGMNCIDTAAIYGMGHSETIVGKAIAGRRDKVVVATKCGMRWNLEEGEFFFPSRLPDGTPCRIYKNLKPDSIRYECEQSLKRLGIDVIDLYQCHWPDATTDLDDTMGVLLDLQRQGKIRAFGMSNFTVEMLEKCLKKGSVASEQSKYNPLEREIEKDLLPFCAKHNVGVLAYSPIAQGLMTGKVTVDREFKGDDVRRGRPWFTAANRQRVLDMLAKIQPIADGHNATLAQVSINWLFSQKGMASALVGARNEEQVAENAGAASFKLSDEELKMIRRLVEDLGQPV